jgi:hypothetical protein
VVLDQLVVGHAAFMHRRFLLVQLRFGLLTAGLLLRDARSMLGLLGPPLTGVGLLAVLAHDLLAPLSQLKLALFDAGAITKPRQQQKQTKQYHRYDDHDHMVPTEAKRRYRGRVHLEVASKRGTGMPMPGQAFRWI